MNNTIHVTAVDTEVEFSAGEQGRLGQVEVVDRLTGSRTVVASESPTFLDDLATAAAHAAEEMRRRRVAGDVLVAP